MSDSKLFDESVAMSILELIPEGVFIVDENSNTPLYANSALCRMTGYDLNGIMNTNTREIIRYQEKFKEGRSKEGRSKEIEVITREGSIFLAEVFTSKLLFNGSSSKCYILKDITEIRKNERMINDQISELRRWHDATLGREVRIIELKREVNSLLYELGRELKYKSVLKERENE